MMAYFPGRCLCKLPGYSTFFHELSSLFRSTGHSRKVTVLDDKEVRRRFRASNYQSTTRQRSHRMLECWFFFTRRSGFNQHVIYAKSTPIFCNEVQKFNSQLFNIHIIYHFLNNCLMIWVVTCWGSSRFPATWLQLWSTSHVQTSGWSRSFVPCRCD